MKDCKISKLQDCKIESSHSYLSGLPHPVPPLWETTSWQQKCELFGHEMVRDLPSRGFRCGLKIKRLIFQFCNLVILQFLLSINNFPQTEYVRVNNPVYDFLERMETLHLITNYNTFEIPKTRGEIASNLKEILQVSYKLDDVDKRILDDLKIEFEYELFKTLNNSQSLIGIGKYDPLSENEKYLFFHSEASKVNFFVNLISEGEMIFSNDDAADKNSSTSLGYIGGEIRGTFLNRFGFYMRGYQGKVFGNTTAAMLRKDIEYNFKFNLEPDEAFFDETEGYLTADFDLVRFKFGRDRLLIGYGNMKPLVTDNPPMFDYLSLNFNYRFLNFTYLHGKVLGERFFENDPVTGGENIVAEKYLGYHRLGFNISPQFNFGIGEIIVYGNRPIDLSYLNPFAFYKSIEHSNQDRDNSMLFFDLNSKVIKGLKIFSNLILDDISFGKIGTGWWGNQALFHAGILSSNLYNIMPLDLGFEYVRIEPYTYTHRLLRNNFTHSGYSIGGIQPNSELFFSQINYRFSSRFKVLAGFRYVIHGANPLNPDGSVKENVGGNILFGHRISDSEKVEFLGGDLEYQRMATFGVFFEPVNLYLLSLKLIYISNSLQKSISQKEFQTFVTLTIKI